MSFSSSGDKEDVRNSSQSTAGASAYGETGQSVMTVPMSLCCYQEDAYSRSDLRAPKEIRDAKELQVWRRAAPLISIQKKADDDALTFRKRFVERQPNPNPTFSQHFSGPERSTDITYEYLLISVGFMIRHQWKLRMDHI